MAGGMQGGLPKGVKMFLLVALLVTAESHMAAATQHVVGDTQGWDLSTNFNTWETGKTFNVGDTLVFKYTPGLHSVVQLGSEADYKSCNIGSPVNSWNGGSNSVKLNKAGTWYFACGTPGHCSGGMKIKVAVLPQGAKSPASSVSPGTPSSSSTSTPAKGNADQSAAASALCSVFALFSVVVSFSAALMVLL